MISLLTVAYQEQGFNLEELPSQCINILNAGLLTTTDQISNGVNALLNHPDQLQKLQQNPTLINSAVEEMIRFDTSVPFFFRIAKQDLTIGGKDITAGSLIALGLGRRIMTPRSLTHRPFSILHDRPTNTLGLVQAFTFVWEPF